MKRGGTSPAKTAGGVPAGARVFEIARAAALAAVLAGWVAFRLGTSICLEDALITFRYAENLARGAGFVFNPGERVLGTTSPWMALVLAVPGAILGTGAIPIAAVVVGMAAGLLTLVFLDSALARCGVRPWLRITGILVAGLHPELLWSTTGGLETPLLLCTMAFGLDSIARGRWIAAGLASALAMLLRPDAAIWAGVTLCVALARIRLDAWRPLAAGAAVLLLWVSFAWAYFGSPIPHSVVAKRAIQPPVEVDYARWLLESLWIPKSGATLPLENGLWLLLAAVGSVMTIASARFRPLIALSIFPPVFGAAFWLGRAPDFPWYLIPVTWCSIALGIVGLEALAGGVAESLRPGRPSLRQGMVVAAVLFELTGIARWAPAAFRFQRANQENEVGLRRRAGEWLDAHTPAKASVAMEAIGYQGTFARRRIVDLAGLVTPRVVQIHRETRTNAEAFERVLAEFQPDALVLRSYEVDGNTLFHGGPTFESAGQYRRFHESYAEAIRMTAPHPGLWGPNSSLTIYRRRGEPSAP